MPITNKDAKPSFAAAAVGVAGVVAVFLSLWWHTQRDEELPAAIAPVQQAEAAPPPAVPAVAPPRTHRSVETFQAFAREGAPEHLPRDHGYTSRGLRLLAQALEDSGIAPSADAATELRAAADEIAADPRSLRHADIARAAFIAVAAAVGGEGEGRAALAAAAEEIDPDRPLRAQRDRVDRFFDEAASAIAGRQES